MSTRPRALVVGASGLLGRHLLLDLATDFDVAGTGYRHLRDGLITLDVTDAGAVERTISTFDPQIILHAAAVSNVAACQENETACHAVNVGGVRNVVAAACGRTLIFFSSDAVFDGSRPSFREQDMPAPLTAYGRQKLEGEVLVQTLAGHLVVRSARYYALKRGNGRFVDLVRGRLESGQPVAAPIDTPGNPTFVEDLSRATRSLIRRGESGLWHLAGAGTYSLYDTARRIADVFAYDPDLVIPVARDHNSPVPRVASCLDTTKARRAELDLRDLVLGLEHIRDWERAQGAEELC